MQAFAIEKGSLAESDFDFTRNNEGKEYFVIMSTDELGKNYADLGFGPRVAGEVKYVQSPKLEMYGSYDYGCVHIPNERNRFQKPFAMPFFLTKNMLIFVSDVKIPVVEKLKEELIANEDKIPINKDKILYLFFERLTSDDFAFLEKLEAQITELEAFIITQKNKDELNKILDFRKKLLFLKSYYEHLLDIVEQLEENENGLIDNKNLSYFKVLANRAERLNRNIANLRDYVTQVREAYQAQVDIELNNIMKIFTVVTSVFLPLTLVVGWYGMNFDMPELEWAWGYPYVICLAVAVLAICIFFFKKHRLF